MSLILDALNRADRERKDRELTPDINTVHDVTYHSGNMPRSRKILIVVVGLLCLAVIVLMYALIQNRNAVVAIPDARPVVVNERPAQPRPTSRPKIQAPSPPVSDQRAQAEAASTTAASSSASASSTPSAEVTSLYADTEEEKVASVDDKVNDLYKPVEELPEPTSIPIQPQPVTPVSLLESADSDADADVETQASQADISTTTYASLQNIPDLRELPWGLQQEIPSIMYSKHNFTQGSVVINGKPRRAGTDIAPKLRLEEIYIDGVKMRFGQQTFKLRALNNWVNM